MPRPDIIHIVVHDLGRTLGCYGRPVQSPHLDAFAAEAVQFGQAYCNAAACSPSRICAMTGLYPQTSGGYGLAHMGWPLPDAVPTLVDHFHDGGYQTAHIGLNHERHAQRNRYRVDLERTWDDHRIDRAVSATIDYLERRSEGDPLYLNVGSREVHASGW